MLEQSLIESGMDDTQIKNILSSQQIIMVWHANKVGNYSANLLIYC